MQKGCDKFLSTEKKIILTFQGDSPATPSVISSLNKETAAAQEINKTPKTSSPPSEAGKPSPNLVPSNVRVVNTTGRRYASDSHRKQCLLL